MSKKEEYDEYENKTMNISELDGTDIKINPDYYIHKALIKAQEALLKDNMEQGFIQFRIIVEHIQVLCRSAKLLDSDFNKKVTEFKDTPDYKEEEKALVKSVLVANKKLELLMDMVFQQKVNTASLSDKKETITKIEKKEPNGEVVAT